MILLLIAGLTAVSCDDGDRVGRQEAAHLPGDGNTLTLDVDALPDGMSLLDSDIARVGATPEGVLIVRQVFSLEANGVLLSVNIRPPGPSDALLLDQGAHETIRGSIPARLDSPGHLVWIEHRHGADSDEVAAFVWVSSNRMPTNGELVEVASDLPLVWADDPGSES